MCRLIGREYRLTTRISRLTNRDPRLIFRIPRRKKNDRNFFRPDFSSKKKMELKPTMVPSIHRLLLTYQQQKLFLMKKIFSKNFSKKNSPMHRPISREHRLLSRDHRLLSRIPRRKKKKMVENFFDQKTFFSCFCAVETTSKILFWYLIKKFWKKIFRRRLG